MEYTQLTLEQGALNRIKSHYRTLEKYRKTSVALHGRQVQSVYSLAGSLGDQVSAIAESYPESKPVQRMARKFEEFVIQHGLHEERVGD